MLFSIFLIFLTLITTVSAAEDLNQTQELLSTDGTNGEVISQDNDQIAETATNKSQSEDIKTVMESNDETIVKGNDFTVKLTDENGNGLVNKTVNFTINKKTTPVLTDDDGNAKFKITVGPGKYDVECTFDEEGYTQSSLTKEILVISTQTPKIKASDYTAYKRIKNPYTVQLTIDGIPLSGRTITFKVNGKTVTKKTNSEGKATLNLNLPTGTYKITYTYAGEDKIKKASGSKKITVKKGSPVKIQKYYSKTYVHGEKGKFKVKLVDAHGNPLANKKVAFKINKKTYIKKTDSKGVASLTIKLKKGTYKIKINRNKDNVYKKATKTFKIKVKSKYATEGGMWLFGRDMKSVNLKTLQKNGFKHVFLNFKALELYGQSGVEKWIKTANQYGVKVHMWMQVFYKSNWINPTKNGKVNMDIINDRVKEAIKYAKVKGAAGVHFDYVRYPGTAYKHSGAVDAVNTFVKKATSEIHKINSKLIVSAAIMPEPSSLKYYYAQDISTMGKYLDALVPMVYKGNYNAGSSWIKSVTKTLDKQSSKAKIWTGLQAYHSDSNVKKLSANELSNDASAAVSGGASAVILFRYGLFNFINFNEV